MISRQGTAAGRCVEGAADPGGLRGGCGPADGGVLHTMTATMTARVRPQACSRVHGRRGCNSTRTCRCASATATRGPATWTRSPAHCSMRTAIRQCPHALSKLSAKPGSSSRRASPAAAAWTPTGCSVDAHGCSVDVHGCRRGCLWLQCGCLWLQACFVPLATASPKYKARGSECAAI